MKQETSENEKYQSLENIKTQISKGFIELRKQVIRQPQGFIKYPYLIPSGFYTQLWDWDAFFMSNHFMSLGEPEYMKSWVLTFSQGIDKDGYVAGCMTTEGPRNVYNGKFAMKPFLSQGAYQYSKYTGDWEWLRPIYANLNKVIEHRQKTQLDTESGLYFWEIAMQSGADNNPALNYQEDIRSFLATDCTAFQYAELLSQSQIAKHLGFEEDSIAFYKEAIALKQALNNICWNEIDQCYYNVDRETRTQYKRIIYSSFVPLMYKMLDFEKGRSTITKYMLSENHMKSPNGFRSLSKSDANYNNQNIIVPFSNWQGPVWGICNFIYSIALHHYGFDEEVKWLALKVGRLMAIDLDTYGTMHETYNGDTGEPPAPSSFKYKTPEGKIQGFVSWNLCIENIFEGLMDNRWMLLDIDGMK